MKRKLKTRVLYLLLITACEPINNDHTYIYLHDLFLNNEQCLVYFYSEHCGHCISIKAEIDNFQSYSKLPFYYLDVDENEITFKPDQDKVIGVNNLEDFYIVGTPSLLEFKESTVSNYYLGESEILEYIRSAK